MPRIPRAVWVALIIHSAALLAVVAGLLVKADGATLTAAILTAGATFGSTVLIGIALVLFATEPSGTPGGNTPGAHGPATSGPSTSTGPAGPGLDQAGPAQ